MEAYRWIIGLIIISIINTTCTTEKQGNSYFISPAGNDTNKGTSPSTAWKTLEKVNQTTFQAGNRILFETGGEWKGNLHPQGSGKEANPIILGSYGTGSRPVINIGEKEGTGIQLINQSWWEIEGIEITSGAPHKLGVRRQGIVATVEGDKAKIEHIVIRDCYIHDIWGQVGGDKSGIAIYVGQRILGQQAVQNCIANEVLIENNIIRRVDKIGIAVNGDEKVVVRGNKLENLGGDGIIVIGANKALLEYNIADRTCLRSGDPDLDTGGEDWWPHTAAIWLWKNTETVMQFNEVYNTGRQAGNGDGFAYDFDFECRKCVLQYNYSANNHGLLLIMNRAYENVARYNISQNDQTHLIQIHGNTEDGNLIHNNVFYVDHSTVDIDFYCGMENEKDKSKMGVTFQNNIFYAGGQGRFRTVYSHGSAIDRQFNDSLKFSAADGGPLYQNNCFWGPWLNGLPEDSNKIQANPRFVEAGSGGRGISSLDGYRLQDDSPCINAGIAIQSDMVMDFYGNAVLDYTTHIGVSEWRPVK